MSTSDLIIYLILSLLIGYGIGFFTVKINHLLVIFLGKLWSSGNAQKRYILVGGIATIVFGMAVFLKTNDFTLTILSTSVFAILFLVGVKHAMHRFNQYLEILNALIQSLFPKKDPNDDQHDALLADTSKISQQMLESMRKSSLESLKILFFFFDSVFAVFLISLTKGKFRFNRFVHLSDKDQVDYMHIWADSEILNLAPVALKALIGYSYYTSHLSWDKIGYRGEVLRRSYIN
ncbi:MAG: hypothetical protein OER78_05490 [Nitrosopumilus sp.]|nr:hypothetical protein [Nitrosopumilus sp.]MDH3855355.1 hypothetical protein [Nitrosopumilus sp.]